jgi:hypothetical protein
MAMYGVGTGRALPMSTLVSIFPDWPLTLRQVAVKLPALTLVTPVAVGGTAGWWCRVVERAVRNLR